MDLITLSAQGDIWVLEFGGLDREVPRWVIYDDSGRFQEWVSGPPDIELLDVVGDRAVTLRRGPFGEEIVEVRRIIPHDG